MRFGSPENVMSRAMTGRPFAPFVVMLTVVRLYVHSGVRTSVLAVGGVDRRDQRGRRAGHRGGLSGHRDGGREAGGADRRAGENAKRTGTGARRAGHEPSPA
jgi:hypothetical protein